MFLTKEAVRLVLPGVAVGVACHGCPPLSSLVARYEAAGGRYFVCPVCVNARGLQDEKMIAGAEITGTIPLWEWIGRDHAVTFSY
jgi:predicted peroxiredoxin